MKIHKGILYAGNIAILLAIVFFTIDQLDRRIQKAVNSPDVLSKLAKHVQLPFIIVDEHGVYRYENNALDLIEKIDIDSSTGSITIIPKEMLAAPPIVEALNFAMAFAEPKPIEPFSWIIYPAESAYSLTLFPTGKEPDPTKKLVRQFKITLIKKN